MFFVFFSCFLFYIMIEIKCDYYSCVAMKIQCAITTWILDRESDIFKTRIAAVKNEACCEDESLVKILQNPEIAQKSKSHIILHKLILSGRLAIKFPNIILFYNTRKYEIYEIEIIIILFVCYICVNDDKCSVITKITNN